MKLTIKEQAVLSLLSKDKTAKEIARIENRSIYTINAQIKSAKLKLGCKTDHGAVAKILQINYGIDTM
jgi:DNA-binding CsgD family transcriptional regulator